MRRGTRRHAPGSIAASARRRAIVDTEKFAALADDVVLDWHRRGWLALVHFHLASLDRFPALLDRQAALATVIAASSRAA